MGCCGKHSSRRTIRKRTIGLVGNLPTIPYGSSIAATYDVDGVQPRVVTMNTEKNIIIIASPDGNKWHVSSTVTSGAHYQTGAGIACVAVYVNGMPRFEVLATTSDNQLICYLLGTDEVKPIVVASGLISSSSVACFKLGDTASLRIYSQNSLAHVMLKTTPL